MELKETLSTLRKQHDITQEDLAEKMKVSRQAVSRWETGESLPSTDNLLQLAELYGVTVEQLTNPKQSIDAKQKKVPAEGPPVSKPKPKRNTGGLGRLIAAAVAGVVLGGLIVGMVVFSGRTAEPEETIPIEDLEWEGIDELPEVEIYLD